MKADESKTQPKMSQHRRAINSGEFTFLWIGKPGTDDYAVYRIENYKGDFSFLLLLISNAAKHGYCAEYMNSYRTEANQR